MDAIKGMANPFGSMSVTAAKERDADLSKAFDAKNDDDRRTAVRDLLLKNIPLASTLYKFATGNVAGGLGDVAPAVAIGATAKLAGPISAAAKVATNPEVVKAGLQVLPKGPAIVNLMNKIGEARGGSTPAPEAAAASPGELLARQAGQDWAKLSADDKAALEAVARGRANAAAQPGATAKPKSAPIDADEVSTPRQSAGARTLQDMIREELQGAKGTAPTTPAPRISPDDPLVTKPFSFGGSDYLRRIEPDELKATQPVSTESPIKVKSLAQTEAAMAQKAPAPTEAPTSQFTAIGERKSPQLRAAEITGANVADKAERWAQALQDSGISSAQAGRIPIGRMSIDQIQKGATPAWGNVLDALQQKGVFDAKETVPATSLPRIIGRLKQMEVHKAAQALADEMTKSGSIQ